MLAEIQINKTKRKVYALDQDYKIIATFPCGTSFYQGFNENGEAYGNAEDGVYNDGAVWAEAKGTDADEPAYGWGYINIDDRGRALHGGGSNLDDPYEPFQVLLPTYGCFRMCNADVYWLALKFLEAEAAGCKPCVHVVSECYTG